MTPREHVVAEALEWVGTPYHHRAQLKGVGVDCARILIAVYCGLGYARPVEPGRYATDWNHHRGEELFETFLVQAGARRVESPGLGDMCLFRYARTYSHGAILVDLDSLSVVHAHQPSGRVRITKLTEAPLLGREVHYWSVF